jgi:hypothetical protein
MIREILSSASILLAIASYCQLLPAIVSYCQLLPAIASYCQRARCSHYFIDININKHNFFYN